MPYHKAIDLARERLRGKGKIGTTGTRHRSGLRG